MGNKPKHIDLRPELSQILKSLDTPKWYTWPHPRKRILLRSERDDDLFYPNGAWVVFVSKGRFGLGWAFDKDGLRVTDVSWLLGGAHSGFHIQWSAIRAVVEEIRDVKKS